MFHIIPDAYIGKIKSDSLVLLSLIISLHNAQYGCIAKNYFFATKLKKTERSIRNYLVELKEMDLIEIEMIQRKPKELPIRVIAPTLNKLPKLKEKLNEIKKRDKVEKERRSKTTNGRMVEAEPDWLEDFIKNEF